MSWLHTARLETRIKELRYAASLRLQGQWHSESGSFKRDLALSVHWRATSEYHDVDPKGGDLY